MTEHADTKTVQIPNVVFTCSLCGVVVGRSSANPAGFKKVYSGHGLAEGFVWVRRPESYGFVGFQPTYPSQLRTDEERMRWFTVEPRCRYHVASYQRPMIPLDEGKVLAWKCLSEDKRSLILVKGILDS